MRVCFRAQLKPPRASSARPIQLPDARAHADVNTTTTTNANPMRKQDHNPNSTADLSQLNGRVISAVAAGADLVDLSRQYLMRRFATATPSRAISLARRPNWRDDDFARSRNLNNIVSAKRAFCLKPMQISVWPASNLREIAEQEPPPLGFPSESQIAHIANRASSHIAKVGMLPRLICATCCCQQL